MRVMLICPVPPQAYWPQGIFQNRFLPTGVACIATVLKAAGHDVRVYMREEHLRKLRLDWQAGEAHLREALLQFAPQVLGLSLCTPMLPEAARLSDLARDLLGSDLRIVAGGPHATVLPRETLQECPNIDAVVIGEGEDTMLELVEHGSGPSVAGIVYRDGGDFQATPPRPPVHDLDRLGHINYDLFDMKYYAGPSRWLIRWLELPATNIRTSRGCTNRCAFCGGYLVAGVGLRFHSVPFVIEQIQQAVERFSVRGIHFEDDTLGANRDRLLAICESQCSSGLHRRIVWDGCLRVDQVDAELLAAMKAAGCIQVEYGMESGSDSSLRRLGKAATVEQNRRAVRLTREAGLRTFADIMIGLPRETAAEVAATKKFLRWARPEVVTASQLCPLPGTAIFSQLDTGERENLDWGAFAYMETQRLGINITAMSDSQLATVSRRFFKRFIQPWLLRQMLHDTAADNEQVRNRLKKALRHFRLRHPVEYARLPRVR